MELKVDKLTFESPAFEPIKKQVDDRVRESIAEIVSSIEKKYEFPRYMNKTQAARYMGVSYNTMVQKYVPAGLQLIIVEGVVRISKDECDRFMKENQK